jgi:hypothetical protein
MEIDKGEWDLLKSKFSTSRSTTLHLKVSNSTPLNFKLVPTASPCHPIESLNAAFIHQGFSQPERVRALNELAISQLRSLLGHNTAGKRK